MYIEITTLKGEHVTNVPTSELNLQKTIEEVKKEYPEGKYHAKLITY